MSATDLDLQGVWMTESQSVIYRAVPKCACSTIGQILYFSDHGRFFDGDIHDAQSGLHKWQFLDSQGVIRRAVRIDSPHTFSCVRNPYTRILSSFFDKICGIQRNGGRYRRNLVPLLGEHYGVEVGSPDDGFAFDQIRSFRRFLLFVRDTIRFYRPMGPDIHWLPMADHVATVINGGGRYDTIFRVEAFNDGMQKVLDAIPARHPVDLATIPRFNESAGHGPKRAHPVEEYFDDLAHHIMGEIYRADFALFRYDADDPSSKAPIGEIDLGEIQERLRQVV